MLPPRHAPPCPIAPIAGRHRAKNGCGSTAVFVTARARDTRSLHSRATLRIGPEMNDALLTHTEGARSTRKLVVRKLGSFYHDT